MLSISSTHFLYASIVVFGVGYTLLKYSRDGDNENRVRAMSMYANKDKTTQKEAWTQLRNLANFQLVEVTWNVFMFIAIVSSLAFLGLAGKLIGDYRPTLAASGSASKSGNKTDVGVGAVTMLFALIVFSLQDLVHKWRNAHRRHPLLKEMIDIMDRLQYAEYKNENEKVLR